MSTQFLAELFKVGSPGVCESSPDRFLNESATIFFVSKISKKISKRRKVHNSVNMHFPEKRFDRDTRMDSGLPGDHF